MYPNEYLIRTLVGDYPKFKLNEQSPQNKKILDSSCGDGRNLGLLFKLGYECYATEITREICKKIFLNLKKINTDIPEKNIRLGVNNALPFDDDFFDYIVAWNSIYYLENETQSILENINEHSRVLKQGGRIICCVPTPKCYSLLNAKPINDLMRIKPSLHKKWGGGGVLNNALFYAFKNKKYIKKLFSSQFKNFKWASLNEDCFGLPLKYTIFVCEKNKPLLTKKL